MNIFVIIYCHIKKLFDNTFILYHLINISLNDNVSIQMQKTIIKSKIIRGLADTTRLSILESLREGEKTTSEIVKETKHNQSNVSNHLYPA